jgi:D-lactate dehydrogenase
MREIKRLCDLAGIMNPEVLLNEDDTAHLQFLKSSIPVEEVHLCVEFGSCKPVCPSRNITLTPRQRIVLCKATASARASGNAFLTDKLECDQKYDSVQSCAVDEICQTACPVSSKTGSLVTRLREEDSTKAEQALWSQASEHWGDCDPRRPWSTLYSAAPTVTTDQASDYAGPRRAGT